MKYNSNHTLIAKWLLDSYQIIFNADGGEVEIDYKVIYTGSLYGTLPTSKKKGYIFLGWFTSPSPDAQQITSVDVFDRSNTIALYARWKAIEHTVHLRGNGANLPLPTSSITVTYGGTYAELPIPTLENYTFDGWYTNPTYGTEITRISVVKTNAEEVLYAHWTGNTQTIYFDANGGTTPTTIKEVYYGRNYGTLPNPSRTGYTFDG